MKKLDTFADMMNQLYSKSLLEQAKNYAYEYIDSIDEKDIYPSDKSIEALNEFNIPMPLETSNPSDILEELQQIGSKNTVSYSGGRYFGFVNGDILPIAMATKWMTDVWDQNAALYVMSPVASKLEEICEKWLVDLLGLKENTAAGFVSGSSTANICAIAVARNELLLKQGHDIHVKGLFGAPPIRVVVGQQIHSSIWKTLSLLGIGKEMVEVVKVDKHGRIIVSEIPPLDSNTLLIIQAGNVNGGAFDPINEICKLANNANAWVHIDGAFGLWAAASKDKRHLVHGLEKADSWSLDAHKTLNAPYDCGIVLCKNKNALVTTMQANGSYLQYSEQRDGMLYVPEMSRRARSIELWAVLKYLGKAGIENLINSLCGQTLYFANQLTVNGFQVINDVVFNQLIVACETPELTSLTLKNIQKSKKCWCGGAVWDNKPVIRISVCSWQTTKQNIDNCIKTFIQCRDNAKLLNF